jgi:hypothetical protein
VLDNAVIGFSRLELGGFEESPRPRDNRFAVMPREASMAPSNRERVNTALELLGAALGPYVDREMTRRPRMGGNWKKAYPNKNVDSDPSALIGVILDNWQNTFRDKLRGTGRNLLGEANDCRNRWAHNESFSDRDAYRALDTIERFLTLIRAPEAAEVGELITEMQGAPVETEARGATPPSVPPFSQPAVKPRPRQDVDIPQRGIPGVRSTTTSGSNGCPYCVRRSRVRLPVGPRLST